MLRITVEHMRQMAAHVAATRPQEACGLLAGRQGSSQQVFPVPNELASATHYSMAPQEQLAALAEIQRQGWELLAIYHSHPNGPPHPSLTDLTEASYPGVAHIIWAPAPSGWSCRAFLLEDGEATPVQIASV